MNQTYNADQVRAAVDKAAREAKKEVADRLGHVFMREYSFKKAAEALIDVYGEAEMPENIREACGAVLLWCALRSKAAPGTLSAAAEDGAL